MIDPSKTYRTRDGREVRIYAVDGGGHRPIHGAVRDGCEWTAYTWLESGEAALHCAGLIEVRPRIQREVWLNVYKTVAVYGIYQDKGSADVNAKIDRIACVKLVIDCEEGHGLD